MDWSQIHNVYFIGIGGIGMSALARYFSAHSRIVAGYDRTPTRLTDELQAEGILVDFNDSADAIPQSMQLPNNTLVVYTPAIPENSQLLLWFRAHGFQVIKRAKVLGVISKAFRTLAVAGTHGKTTTSSMLAHVMHYTPTGVNALLGGIVQGLNSNYIQHSSSPWLVVEADEFDRSFLHLLPEILIVNAMDPDHLDIYHTADAVTEAYFQLMQLVPGNGIILYANGLAVASNLQHGVKAYSFGIDDPTADIFARNIVFQNGQYHFDLQFHDQLIPDFQLAIPGLINIKNACAALAAALYAGAHAADLQAALSSFKGVRRRFEVRFQSDELIFIDDYAHHPAELTALAQGIRHMYPQACISVIFQPHLYSRTRDFAQAFAEALNLFDKVLLMPVYPAREQPIPDITERTIGRHISAEKLQYASETPVMKWLNTECTDILITAGAGSIENTANDLAAYLQKGGQTCKK